MPRYSNIWKNVEFCKDQLPYCLAVMSDGRERLLNRRYKEIWVRGVDGWVQPGDPTANGGARDYTHFYLDANPPWLNSKSRARCHAALRAWNVDCYDPFRARPELDPDYVRRPARKPKTKKRAAPARAPAKHRSAFMRKGGAQVTRHRNVVYLVDWQRAHGPH